MSTTVRYKGNSLGTFSGDTMTLNTEGKYLEANVIIEDTPDAAPTPTLQNKSKTYTPTTSQQSEAVRADAGYDGLDEVGITVNPIPSQYIVPTGTKQIPANVTDIDVAQYEKVDVNVPAPPPVLAHYGIRPDATLVQAFTYDKLMHADEQITLPGYSTSAQTIKASAALGTITLDRDNYQYYVVERFLTIPQYSVTSHNKGRCEYHIGAHVYEIIDIPGSSLHSLIEPTRFYTSRLNTITTTMASYREIYYSGSSTLTTYSTQAYGVCQAAVAPSMSSGVLTINSPTVTCRGSTTYFTSTYANALTDVRAQYVIEVYKAPKNNLNYDGWSNDQLMKQIIACVNNNTQTLS